MYDFSVACLPVQIPLPAYLKDILLEDGQISEDGLLAEDGAAANSHMMTRGLQNGEQSCPGQAELHCICKCISSAQKLRLMLGMIVWTGHSHGAAMICMVCPPYPSIPAFGCMTRHGTSETILLPTLCIDRVSQPGHHLQGNCPAAGLTIQATQSCHIFQCHGTCFAGLAPFLMTRPDLYCCPNSAS